MAEAYLVDDRRTAEVIVYFCYRLTAHLLTGIVDGISRKGDQIHNFTSE